MKEGFASNAPDSSEHPKDWMLIEAYTMTAARFAVGGPILSSMFACKRHSVILPNKFYLCSCRCVNVIWNMIGCLSFASSRFRE